jgi:hypothetical protein
VGVHPPPSRAWANFSIMMECMPESGRCHSVYSLLCILKQEIFFCSSNFAYSVQWCDCSTNFPQFRYSQDFFFKGTFQKFGYAEEKTGQGKQLKTKKKKIYSKNKF